MREMGHSGRTVAATGPADRPSEWGGWPAAVLEAGPGGAGGRPPVRFLPLLSPSSLGWNSL